MAFDGELKLLQRCLLLGLLFLYLLPVTEAAYVKVTFIFDGLFLWLVRHLHGAPTESHAKRQVTDSFVRFIFFALLSIYVLILKNKWQLIVTNFYILLLVFQGVWLTWLLWLIHNCVSISSHLLLLFHLVPVPFTLMKFVERGLTADLLFIDGHLCSHDARHPILLVPITLLVHEHRLIEYIAATYGAEKRAHRPVHFL